MLNYHLLAGSIMSTYVICVRNVKWKVKILQPIPENYSDELGDVVDILLTKQPASRPRYLVKNKNMNFAAVYCSASSIIILYICLSAQEILRLPFLKTELLAYIEENEYILQHQRLPTRQDSRPYTTNAIRYN